MFQFLSTVFICEHSRKMPTSVLTIHIYIPQKMIVPRILCNFPIPEDSEGSICRSPVSQAPYQSPAKTSPRKRGISTIGSEENIQHISTILKWFPVAGLASEVA